MNTQDTIDKGNPILLVDDFIAMRRITKSYLKSQGFTNIIEADDGKDALSKLRQNSCSIIISDLTMPSMSGLELMSMIGSDKALRKIPFLLIGGIDEILKLKGENILEEKLLVKPFAPKDLQRKIENILK